MRVSPRLGRRRVLGLSLAVWSASLGGVSADDALNVLVNDAFDFTGTQLTHLAEEVLVDEDVFTDYTDTDGKWLLEDKETWTSGMTAGVFWYQYACTGDEVFRGYAEKWTEGLEGVETADDNDVGFQVFNSYGLGYKLVGDESYKDMVLTGADTLYSIRYQESIPAFWSWANPKRRPDWDIAVNVDMMMNMEIVLWAAMNGGDDSYTSAVINHADTTWKDIVRDDNSTYHVAAYDPDTGELVDQGTYQGAGNETTWSRGQAWAVHGFVMVYRYTKEPRFLEYSLGLLRYFLDNLPDDDVPPADFDAEIDDANGKDSSSTAIVASALFEMFWTLERPHYLEKAQRLLKALFEPDYYQPDATDGYESILRRASQDYGDPETGAIFGDYYFLETLERYKRVAPSIVLRDEESVDVPGSSTTTSDTASGGIRRLQTLTGGTHCALKIEGGVLGFDDGCEPEAPDFLSEEISPPSPTPVPLAVTPSPIVDPDGLPGTSPPTVSEAEASPAPTEGSPSPTEGSPSPAEGSPSPAEGSPSPAEGSPSPEGTPSPVEGSPSPVEGTPSPVEGSPSPVEGTLSPVEGSPSPAGGTASPAFPSVATPSPVAATSVPTMVTPVPSGSSRDSSFSVTFGSSLLDNDVDLSELNEEKEVLIWFGVTLVGADVYPSLLGFELNGSDVVEVEVEAPGGGWQAGQNTVKLVAEPGSFTTSSSSGATTLSRVAIYFTPRDFWSSGVSEVVTVDWLILGHDLAL